MRCLKSLALFLCSLLSQSAISETPLPETAAPETPAAVASATPRIKRPTELLELEADMAEINFEKIKNSQTFNALSRAYEKLLGPLCIAPPKSMQKEDAKRLCEEYILRAARFNPELPALICARDGNESNSCKQAYRLLEIRILDSEAIDALDPAVELDLKMQRSKDKVLRESLSRQAEKAAKNYESDRSAENLKNLRDTFSKLLPVVCKFTYLHVMQAPRESATKIPLTAMDVIISRPNPLGDAVKRYADVNSVHVRFLTPECFRQIESVLKLDPNWPAAVCHRDGTYSPTCFESSRTFRKKQEALMPKETRVSDGLESF
ncbi:MAG: hypothetical protein DCC75_05585 [Proteobacteria bacterium]|nr:MAG: hypothetical protein DCC75_05585 [Pseudomonadota bacterium]